jgi:hypothetical protein
MPRQRKTTQEPEMPTATTATTAATEAAKTENKVVKALVATPVSASELASITAQMQGKPKDEVALACGYYTSETLEDGTVSKRVRKSNLDSFIDAVMTAAGMTFAPPATRPTRTNRPPTVKLTEKGAIVLGGRYAAAAGFEFGPGVENKVLVHAELGLITVRLYESGATTEAPDEEQDEDQDQDGADSELDDLDL